MQSESLERVLRCFFEYNLDLPLNKVILSNENVRICFEYENKKCVYIICKKNSLIL